MGDFEREEEIDLREYFRIIKKRWKVIALIIFFSVLISCVILYITPHQYETSAMLKIGKVRGNPLESPGTLVEIFKKKPILEKVAIRLNLSTDEETLNEIEQKFTISKRAGLLEIKGRDKTPEDAIALVNVIVELIMERHKSFFAEGRQILKEYIDDSNKRLKNLEVVIENIKKKIAKLENTDSQAKALIARGYMERLESTLRSYRDLQVALRERRMEESYATEATRIDIPSKLPEIPVSPNKRLIVMIVGFLSIIVGVIGAFFVEYIYKNE